MKPRCFGLLVSAFSLLGWVACTSPQSSPLTPVPIQVEITLGVESQQQIYPPLSNPTPTQSHSPTATVTFSLPAPGRTPSAPTCAQGGQMIYSSLQSDKLRHPLDYRVYLPPCYEPSTDQQYPVLYLIHGQSYTDDQWDRLGADDVAEQLITQREIAPFLIVMPRDRLWEQPQDDPFGEVLIHELIPFIDRTYRTNPQRAFRAIGGLSRGAGWAVHLGLRYWQFFGSIGAHSLAVFESDAPKIERWLDAIPPEAMPRIFLDIGDRDRPPILQSAIWFEQLLTRKQIPHEWYLYSGYHHEAYWQAHVEQYIRWYAAPWTDIEFDIIEP